MEHPLFDTIIKYLSDFPALKRDNEDLDNLSFYQDHGLSIKCPNSWPVYKAIEEACNYADGNDMNNIVVVYPTTVVYNAIFAVAPQHVQYIAWQEYFAAMYRVNEDARYLKQLKSVLSGSDLVIFLGASTAITDVVSQIQATVNGCLLLFA